jgi:hypothetical protein
MKFWESAVLAALLFVGVFGPIFLMMADVDLFPHIKKEPAPPSPPPIVVKVSCEGPSGWVTFSAERKKVRISPYRSAGWRIETVRGKRIAASNCFMQEGSDDE